VRTPGLVVGVGCREHTTADELFAHVAEVLGAADLDPGEVVLVATLDRRSTHPAVLGLAAALGASVEGVSARGLEAEPAPTPSPVVARAAGTASVAEAAVLAVGARLLVPKHVGAASTVAVGRRD